MSTWKIGDIVSVEWPESRYGVALAGTWDGRITAKDGDKLTVHFEYGAYEEGGAIQRSDDEDIVIDMGTRIDEKYGEKVIVRRPTRGKERRS
jgi:hypothetical protein